MTGFRFVYDHQAEHHIVDLCRVAGVARSSYYALRTRTPCARQRANNELLVEIREIHEQSRRTYGCLASLVSFGVEGIGLAITVSPS